MPDVELVKFYGSDPKNRYFYTMVYWAEDEVCFFGVFGVFGVFGGEEEGKTRQKQNEFFV